MTSLDYPPGPERDAYRAGAAAEARLREAPRDRLPRDVREVLNYLDALAEHQPHMISTPGAVLERVARIFASTVTREEEAEIRHALAEGRRVRRADAANVKAMRRWRTRRRRAL